MNSLLPPVIIGEPIPDSIDPNSLIQYGLEVQKGILEIVDNRKLMSYLSENDTFDAVVKTKNEMDLDIVVNAESLSQIAEHVSRFRQFVKYIKRSKTEIGSAIREKISLTCFNVIVIGKQKKVKRIMSLRHEHIVTTECITNLMLYWNTEKKTVGTYSLKAKAKNTQQDLSDVGPEDEDKLIEALQAHHKGNTIVVFEDMRFKNNILTVLQSKLGAEHDYFFMENDQTHYLKGQDTTRNSIGIKYLMYGIWCNILVSDIKLFLGEDAAEQISSNTDSFIQYLIKYCTNYRDLYESLTSRNQDISLKSIFHRKYKSTIVKFDEPKMVTKFKNEEDDEFVIREELYMKEKEKYDSIYKTLKTLSEALDKLDTQKKYGMVTPHIRKNGKGEITIDVSLRKTPKNYKNGTEKMSYGGFGDIVRRSAQGVFEQVFQGDSEKYVLTSRFDQRQEDQYRIFSDTSKVHFANGLKQLYHFFKNEIGEVEGIETETDLDLMTDNASATDIESDLDVVRDDSVFETL